MLHVLQQDFERQVQKITRRGWLRSALSFVGGVAVGLIAKRCSYPEARLVSSAGEFAEAWQDGCSTIFLEPGIIYDGGGRTIRSPRYAGEQQIVIGPDCSLCNWHMAHAGWNKNAKKPSEVYEQWTVQPDGTLSNRQVHLA